MYCGKCSLRHGQKIEMIYYKPLNVWECFNCGNQQEANEEYHYEIQ